MSAADDVRPERSGVRGFVGALIGERPGALASVIVAQALTGIGQAVTVLLVVPLLDAVGVGGQSALRRSIRGTTCRRAPEMCSDPQLERTRQELPTRHIYLADAAQAGLLAVHRSDNLGRCWRRV